MRLRSLVCLLFAAVPLCTFSPAFANPKPGPDKRGQATPPPAPKDRADELFDQATTAVDAGRLQEAEAKLEEAWALKQTHDIAGNLGIVKAHLGKNREAVEHLTWALQHLPPTESSLTRKGLEAELAKARAEVGALRVRVNVEGAEIAVNGRAAGSSPLAGEVFVEPGIVNVSVRRDGYQPAEAHVQVAKGASQEVTVTLEQVKVAPETGTPKSRSIVPGVVLGGAAGVALATGIGLLVDAGAKGSSARGMHDAIVKAGHSCVAGAANYDSRCVELHSTASAGDTRHGVGVGLLVGGSAAAVGAAVYLLWPRSSAGVSSAHGLSLAPAVSTTNAGLVFSGTF